MITERTLVLHQITAMDVPPPDFARMAAEAGCDQISVFTNCPDAILPGQSARLDFPTITEAMKRDMRAALADHGVRVNGVEYFPVLADLDVRDYLPGLALGGELGGVRAVTHIHDTDAARAVDSIGRLCELAASQGLTIGVEFTPMTRGCASLDRAAWFVDQVGRADFAIVLDCLHLIRSGASAADAARLGSRYFVNGQICDGHGLQRSESYMPEAHNRELPGKGDFPIAEILAVLDPAAPIEIEAPSARLRESGVSAQEHLRAAVACSRAVLAEMSAR
jgi:sugar phosphate isomerase/epimerase